MWVGLEGFGMIVVWSVFLLVPDRRIGG